MKPFVLPFSLSPPAHERAGRQFPIHLDPPPLFTCGRRPTGHGVIQIVVVVVVVGVVGGGETSFIHGHWESPCMVL